MSSLLQAREIGFAFGGRRVLDAVSCSFERGWTAIVGPNGAGKSTLLRLLAGLAPPLQGEVWLDGAPLRQWSARERGQRVAWLGQGGETSGDLTVRETVMLGRMPHTGLFTAPRAEDDAAVERAMSDTECAPWAERRLIELSGGERQRALLARALATEAPVLLLDEPTTHLDPPHQVALARLARRWAEQRVVVSVMHDLALALAADRVIVLVAGRIAALGAPHEAALQAAVRSAFSNAVRIEQREGRISVMPDL
jgi:iron complex transport system ATP-binding protein